MGEKYVLEFNPVKRYDRLCKQFVEEFDYFNIHGEKERDLVRASLGVFKKNCKNVRALIADETCPLHDISPKTLDTVFRYLKFMMEIDLKHSKFRHRPLPLLQSTLMLVVVGGCYKVPGLYLTSSRNINNMANGNFEEIVGKGHTIEKLRSLCKFGKDSKYWDKVQKYLDFTI